MAGAKETPRQKMVGMMYLVLTALLALQVSSSIIDKFLFLNSSLEIANSKAEASSEASIAALEKTIKDQEEKGGKASPVALKNLDRAKELRKKTKAMLARIESFRQKIVKEAGDGVDPKTGQIKNAKEETKVEIMMIATNKKGQGYTLKKELDDFVTRLYNDYKDLGIQPFDPLTPTNEKNPLYKTDPINRGKDWVNASFGQTPVAAAIAVLEQKKSEVIRYEQEILKRLGAVDVDNAVKFDKIVAMVSAESSVLAPGDEFRAKMFLAASASNIKSTMTFNGGPVTVRDGVGEVKIPIAAGVKGSSEVPWKAVISFVDQKGENQTYETSGKYTVVEAVLQISSGTLNPLYINCANPLVTSVPALGASYNPSFDVSQGRAIPGSQKGEVTVVPANLGKLTLGVSSGGNKIGSKEFDVIPTPPPTVALFNSAGDKEIPLDKPVPLGNFQILAQPEPNFYKALPKECSYRVTGVIVTHIRGGAGIGERSYSSGSMNLPKDFDVRKGDALSFKITGVQRASSLGGIEDIKIKQSVVTIAIK